MENCEGQTLQLAVGNDGQDALFVEHEVEGPDQDVV